ncbi:CerR family C-terminal domain-containing protein [Nitratidesulfovibrio sp. SRB-5]|uniref:CerR family C-terminal domain-containing protein n=1 Tax=Nitratidesulfovibrio sp. SRB-5 TaxID=2872636 RepID=UPI00167CD24E|nr:CerR family C-terminal domain-containing protein [Nitratidesulfovibrio sp. SRB-5]MBZ2170708.1 CerR family C-terminal domain-containing protein [Nitratidesulfovibrio sp. SRB-5]
MQEQQDDETRARLLRAARVVFASDGLKRATIRKISTLARANIAAVNYHFGSKENLYVAVLRDHLEQKLRRNPRDAGVSSLTSPRGRLRAYVRSMLTQFACDGDAVSARLGKLLSQEFVQSSSRCFQTVIESCCGPAHAMLLDIVRQLLPGSDSRTVSRCAGSIMGQCVLHAHASEVIRLISPDMVLKPSNVESMADFIVEFTLGGIERLSVGLPGHSPSPIREQRSEIA